MSSLCPQMDVQLLCICCFMLSSVLESPEINKKNNNNNPNVAMVCAEWLLFGELAGVNLKLCFTNAPTQTHQACVTSSGTAAW